MPRRDQLEEMLKSSPDDPFLHYALALDDVSAGNADAGIARLENLIGFAPDYVAAYFQLGQLYADAGRTEDARDRLTRGIAVAEKVGDAHAAGEMTGVLAMLE